jgi:DNA-binding NtrC family response regulator
LKNVAEQVSILELNRKVTADVMLRYLPEQPKNNLPTLLGGASSGKTFESEREILYSVLFDMRRDITELKKQIEGLRSTASRDDDNIHLYTEAEEVMPVVQHAPQAMIHLAPSAPVHQLSDDEYVEEAISLDDMEKKAIKQALERHRGRRRDAAKDLNISERTLYRKIKEYGIE